MEAVETLGIWRTEMNKKPSDDQITIWERLVESHKAFASASHEFLATDVDRVALVRSALRGKDRSTAIYMLSCLPASELQALFSDLVFLASFSHGSVQKIRDAILSLPKAWVLANIEAIAEPLLQAGTYDEYRRLLELYAALDHGLALQLARRAADHGDEDIREAGEDFLVELETRPSP